VSVATRPPQTGTVVRFLVSGGLNTAATFLLFRVLLHLVGRRPGAPAVAQATAYAVGIALSFALNRGWTFRAQGRPGQLPRFIAAHLGSLTASAALMELGVTHAGLSPTVCWLLLVGPITAVNFTLQRYWVFA
jgi:putative flippase GtrA